MLMSQRQCIGEPNTVTGKSGRQILYHQIGHGHRIVACASAGRPGSDFNELADNLVDAGFRILIVEAPGINGADNATSPLSLYDLADDLHSVVSQDATKTNTNMTATGLGHGFGNRIVRAAASRYSSVFRASILVGPGMNAAMSEQAQASLKACFDRSTTRRRRYQHIRSGLFAPTSNIPPWWRSGWKPHTAAMQGKATSQTRNEHWKRAGNGPVLIVVGEQDVVAPPEKVCPELSSLLGNRAQIGIINNAGHALVPEQTMTIARTIADFCRLHSKRTDNTKNAALCANRLK